MCLLAVALALVVACERAQPGNPGVDAGVNAQDSGLVDEDLDGFPADEDCDDRDPAIYPGQVRECSSLCDSGVETCLADGSFSACTATSDADCGCSIPGETRVASCGNCGTGSQTCGPDLIWGPVEACVGEGECAVGEVEEGPCEFCGTATRICDDTCSWSAWDGCFGTCQPGEVETSQQGCAEAYEYAQRTCGAQCDWEETTPCTADCHGSPRTGTNDYSDEVCIPGGPFVMGNPAGVGEFYTQPQHTVELSPYFIDVFPVTIARYRGCVQAGACAPPQPSSLYHQPGYDDYPMAGATYGDALDFCAWDGGRAIPTEAQWEKAARGPAPRTVLYPWGDTPPTCAEVNLGSCGEPLNLVPVDFHPPGASYYGVRHLGGNGAEWCLDWFDFDYYSVSPTLDPPGPSQPGFPDARVLRSTGWPDAIDSAVTYRGFGDFDDYPAAIRCARTGH